MNAKDQLIDRQLRVALNAMKSLSKEVSELDYIGLVKTLEFEIITATNNRLTREHGFDAVLIEYVGKSSLHQVFKIKHHIGYTYISPLSENIREDPDWFGNCCCCAKPLFKGDSGHISKGDFAFIYCEECCKDMKYIIEPLKTGDGQ